MTAGVVSSRRSPRDLVMARTPVTTTTTTTEMLGRARARDRTRHQSGRITYRGVATAWASASVACLLSRPEVAPPSRPAEVAPRHRVFHVASIARARTQRPRVTKSRSPRILRARRLLRHRRPQLRRCIRRGRRRGKRARRSVRSRANASRLIDDRPCGRPLRSIREMREDHRGPVRYSTSLVRR